jgi:hypothetical protein
MDSDLNLSDRAADETPKKDVIGVHERIIGDSVVIRQGAVQSIEANDILVRQGGIVTSHANHIEINAGGSIWNQAETIHLNNSSAVAVVVKGDSSLDQSSVKVMAARGTVTMDQSAAGVLAAREITLKNSAVVFLIAKNVNGDVKPMFSPREAVLFGAMAGLVGSLVFLIGKLFGKKSR